MLEIAEKAATLWPLDVAELVFTAHRENAVFKVTSSDQQVFALRLHRPGYRSRIELTSEMEWMAALAAGGMEVPRPISSKEGSYIGHVDGHDVSLLTWLQGAPLGKSGQPLQLDDPAQRFFAIGRQMARLHLISDAWTPPTSFKRHRWDEDGLLGEAPVWGRFWENPELKPLELSLFMDVVAQAKGVLRSEQKFDFGLVHADLLRENILVEDGSIRFIDFDDGGFGYRLFELATTLHRVRHEENFEQLRTSLLSGYRSLRSIDTQQLNLFIALRAFTYLGWIVTRIHEPDKAARNPRLIAEAVEAAKIALSDLS